MQSDDVMSSIILVFLLAHGALNGESGFGFWRVTAYQWIWMQLNGSNLPNLGCELMLIHMSAGMAIAAWRGRSLLLERLAVDLEVAFAGQEVSVGINRHSLGFLGDQITDGDNLPLGGHDC